MLLVAGRARGRFSTNHHHSQTYAQQQQQQQQTKIKILRSTTAVFANDDDDDDDVPLLRFVVVGAISNGGAFGDSVKCVFAVLRLKMRSHFSNKTVPLAYLFSIPKQKTLRLLVASSINFLESADN
jgi:hypothetical protein